MIGKYKLVYNEKFSPEFDEYWGEVIEIIKSYENFYFLEEDKNSIMFICDKHDLSDTFFDYRGGDDYKIFQKILKRIDMDSCENDPLDSE